MEALPIRDGSMNFNGQTLDQVRQGYYGELARARGVQLPKLGLVSNEPSLPAVVNHGRWIVYCPDCPGAEFVFLETPLMICMSCLNAVNGMQWRRVAVPHDRAEIERILLPRLPANRHWQPGDGLDEMRAVNIAHGLAEEVEP